MDVTLTLRPGEIVGIVGHNGAGKSTLVNVATGALRPDAGRLHVDGEEVAFKGDPVLMEEHGVRVIHQDPALVPNLSVADNITLAHRSQRLPTRERRRLAAEALSTVGASIDVDRQLGSLRFGERQLVALARALSGEVGTLFLDEPTGALAQAEIDRLHALLRELASAGKAIAYVSHRLRDVLEVCSRTVLMREGSIVLDKPTTDLSPASLSSALAPGIDQGLERVGTESKLAAEVLSVDTEQAKIRVPEGQILGLFGMAAGPQFALLDDLYGLGETPNCRLNGIPFAPRSPVEAIKRGVFMVPPDRERDAILPLLSAVENLCMPWMGHMTKGGTLRAAELRKMYSRVDAALGIRGAPMNASIASFSGGNRQRLVLGRWLFGPMEPAILLMSQPTRGVDVGARADIARALREAAARGVTMLVASSEADEIALLCDDALVCEGTQWVHVPSGPEWERRLIEALLTGVVVG